MADFDEFEDEYEEEGDFEEFDEDFEAAGAEEVKVRVANGLDTFCIVFSFFLALGAVGFLGYGVLYEVYDVRMGGIFPAKTIPPHQYEVTVEGFGRDKDLSGVYNYAVLGSGRMNGLYPGQILVYELNEQEVLRLVVTEDIGDSSCRADIVWVQPVALKAVKEGAASAGTYPRQQDWNDIDNTTEACLDLTLLLNLQPDKGPALKVKPLPWSAQAIVQKAESFAGNERVPPEQQ